MEDLSYELIGAERDPSWIVLCDHASNRVPDDVAGGDLGLPVSDMNRHIAWDVGARGVALALAERLGCPMIATRFSRLVIDPNRAEDDPTLLMKLYDGSVIPGNRNADAAEKERRLNRFHRPYHDAVTALIDGALAKGVAPKLLSVHSFTPQLRGRPRRPWEIGLLWDRDDRIFRPLYDRLLRERNLTVGDNEPYSGELKGDCMWRHGTARGLEHVLIEIRNDLIETEEPQRQWGEDLARWITDAMAAREGARRILTEKEITMDDQTRTELEAAAFRRLRDHLRERTDAQNIDMMNLAGFCRNCLSRWYQEAANEKGLEMSKEDAREAFYGMPYDEWKDRYQTEASEDQKAAFAKSHG